MHKPIQIKQLCLSFPHKTCFDDFTTQILCGSRIAIIGRNGTGKSSLLKILQKLIPPTQGFIDYEDEITFGFVPQILNEHSSLSGGQQFNKALTKALSLAPNVLLLDEPTNHLDQHNRKSLFKMLEKYHGTLIIVSHDPELLRNTVDTLWHIDQGKINIFSGNYDHYIQAIKQQKESIHKELSQLSRQKDAAHQALMQEQQRAAKSRSKGEKSIEQRKWPSVVSKTKALRAEKTSGKKKSAIASRKQSLLLELDSLRLPEEIIPTFSLTADIASNSTLLSISDGSIGYEHHSWLLEKINLFMQGQDRIAILGNNASGKSTLIKAILQTENILTAGTWKTPKRSEIGYLDQHYHSLHPDKTVYETLSELMPNQSKNEIRSHLNRFLFRKNEEVDASVTKLSGGERARLVLAQIAAATPKLLILDEITNNIDLETRAHVIQVLKEYPAGIIVISHDDDFINQIEVRDKYQIMKRSLCRVE